MEGSKQARNILNKQPRSNLTDNKPNVSEDIRTVAGRPGFLTWKKDDDPWFNLKGNAKITGQAFALDTALQQKLNTGSQKQGRPVQEFPNVKPLVVEAPSKDDDDDDDDKAKSLGQVDTSCCGSKKWLYAAGVFSLGLAAGWWLARRS